jgi:hypothetical protein
MQTTEKTEKEFDVVGFVMDLEMGMLPEDAVVEGMQHLIDNGMVWNLQGAYGRLAERLIEAGLCHR